MPIDEAREADTLVHRGLRGPDQRGARATAVERLRSAIAQRKSSVPVWVHACARMRAEEAEDLIILLLAPGTCAVHRDAAIQAVRLIHSPEKTSAVASRLLEIAADLIHRPETAETAEHALLGALLLDPAHSREHRAFIARLEKTPSASALPEPSRHPPLDSDSNV